MKSIIEEASTITKAIDACWERAGKPKEFSVRILEEPEKSFWGFTTKPAKVALLFEDKKIASSHSRHKDSRPAGRKPHAAHDATDNFTPSSSTSRSEQREQRNDQRTEQRLEQRPEQREQRNDQRRQAPKPAQPAHQAPKKEHHVEAKEPSAPATPPVEVWNQDAVNAALAWMRTTLDFMDFNHVTMESTIAGSKLRIQLSEQIFENKQTEKQFFSSSAHLTVEMIKNKVKKNMRNAHIIFSTK